MRKLGLVFAGGGAKGAYQIGVWKALEEFGITDYITVVSGSSVGALNGTLFAQGDYKIAENIWNDIDKSFLELKPVKPENWKEVIAFLSAGAMGYIPFFAGKIGIRAMNSGIMNRNKLERIIDDNISKQKLDNNTVKLIVTVTPNKPIKWFPEDISNNECLVYNKSTTKEELKSWLFASSALPVVYGVETIDGVQYRDGGLSDNVPVQYMDNENIDGVVIVRCSQDKKDLQQSCKKKIVLDIIPSVNTGNFFKGTINFSNEYIRKTMNYGYRDAIMYLYNTKDLPIKNKKKLEDKLQEINYEIIREAKEKDYIEITGLQGRIVKKIIEIWNSPMRYVLILFMVNPVYIEISAPLLCLLGSTMFYSGFIAMFIAIKEIGLKNLFKYDVHEYDSKTGHLILKRKSK